MLNIDVLAMQPKNTYVPGESGVWVFVIGDMLLFSLFFGIYMWYRGDSVEIYKASQQLLSKDLGATNMVLLLISSWLVAVGVKEVRNNSRLAFWMFSLAWLCGLMFCGVKIFEYYEKIQNGITPVTNEFFMFYFIFTGIHFFHVLVGLGVLGYLVGITKNNALSSGVGTVIYEGGATFWHMVDLLWIVLFPLIYLL